MNINFINERKKTLGLTNQMIADRTGITLSTLDKITSGINDNPKLSTIKAIASVLNCSLDDFDSDSASIGKQIKEARIYCGLTQQQLAEAIGVAKSTIAGYEKGLREPDSKKINALAKALNVSGDYILGTEYDWLPSADAIKVAKRYDSLDADGRELVNAVISHEERRIQKRRIPQHEELTEDAEAAEHRDSTAD